MRVHSTKIVEHPSVWRPDLEPVFVWVYEYASVGLHMCASSMNGSPKDPLCHFL